MFDDVINDLKSWFQQKEATGETKHYQLSADEIRNEPDQNGGQSGIILKEDTLLELGHPSVGSLNASLTTNESSLIDNGHITVIGPEISEMQGRQLPFAQIAVGSCQEQVNDLPFLMDRALHTSAQTDEYMVRTQPGAIWARLSKSAATSGFSFEQLGKRLIQSLLHKIDSLEHLELFFVTGHKSDIGELTEIIAPAKTRLNKLKTFARTDDGEYECSTDLDCDDCSEQEVCDTIRDVIKIRKGDRIIHFDEDSDPKPGS